MCIVEVNRRDVKEKHCLARIAAQMSTLRDKGNQHTTKECRETVKPKILEFHTRLRAIKTKIKNCKRFIYGEVLRGSSNLMPNYNFHGGYEWVSSNIRLPCCNASRQDIRLQLSRTHTARYVTIAKWWRKIREDQGTVPSYHIKNDNDPTIDPNQINIYQSFNQWQKSYDDGLRGYGWNSIAQHNTSILTETVWGLSPSRV